MNLAFTLNGRPCTAEAPGEMLRRGGATIRSRQRAVAPADYAALAADTPGVEVARAHALPARDARLGAGAVPGYVTVVVLPVAESPDRPPTPSAETLAAVAELQDQGMVHLILDVNGYFAAP